jgi:hypothetical protein
MVALLGTAELLVLRDCSICAAWVFGVPELPMMLPFPVLGRFALVELLMFEMLGTPEDRVCFEPLLLGAPDDVRPEPPPQPDPL